MTLCYRLSLNRCLSKTRNIRSKKVCMEQKVKANALWTCYCYIMKREQYDLVTIPWVCLANVNIYWSIVHATNFRKISLKFTYEFELIWQRDQILWSPNGFLEDLITTNQVHISRVLFNITVFYLYLILYSVPKYLCCTCGLFLLNIHIPVNEVKWY